MTKRKFLSIFYYHLGHNADRLLYMISPVPDWVGDKLADLYQWAMWKSVKYDDFYEVWKKAPPFSLQRYDKKQEK
jgi:hypothetical protein